MPNIMGVSIVSKLKKKYAGDSVTIQNKYGKQFEGTIIQVDRNEKGKPIRLLVEWKPEGMFTPKCRYTFDV